MDYSSIDYYTEHSRGMRVMRFALVTACRRGSARPRRFRCERVPIRAREVVTSTGPRQNQFRASKSPCSFRVYLIDEDNRESTRADSRIDLSIHAGRHEQYDRRNEACAKRNQASFQDLLIEISTIDTSMIGRIFQSIADPRNNLTIYSCFNFTTASFLSPNIGRKSLFTSSAHSA